MPEAFASYPRTELDALVGHWLVASDIPGQHELWIVEEAGRKLTTLDARGRERVYGLALQSPCSLAISDEFGRTRFHHFARIGERFYSHPTGASAIAGSDGSAIACVGTQTIIVPAEGPCVAYSQMLGVWSELGPPTKACARELPADLVVLPLQPAEAYGALSAGAEVLEACRSRAIPVASNTVLTPAALPMLLAAARVAARGQVQSHGFTFPFPVDGQAEDIAPAPRAVAALAPAVRLFTDAGIRVWIKGLPGCYLASPGGPDLASLIHRSANRWYVDADHQRERALMFFPDVVAFFKEDTCRYCALDWRCDGFFATFLRRPGFPPLVPIEEVVVDPPMPAL